MKHTGMMLGLMISTLGLPVMAANKPAPAKPPISIAANLNPQVATTAKSKPEEATPDAAKAPSVLEPGSRVVASNAPDEDFVILGRLDKALPEAPKPTPSEALGEPSSPVQVMAEVTAPLAPPVVLKAPVEVKSGIQTPATPKVVVVVAGPNIGAAPAVKKPTVSTPVVTKALNVALIKPHKEASALKPPPKVIAYLEKPEKPVKPAKPAKPSVAVVVHPAIQSHPATKLAIKKAPIKKITVAVAKPHAKAAVIKPVVVKSVAAKKVKLKKPVIIVKKTQAPAALAFASYHPPKHKTKLQPIVASVKTPKTTFKPVIKPYKSASVHAARKSHFHPVIKPYITS